MAPEITPADRIAAYVQAWKHGPVPTMLERLVLAWLRIVGGCWKIRTQEQEIVPLTPNLSQQMVMAAMMDMAAEERHIIVNILKSRKTGVSTWFEVVACDICAHYENQNAVVVAHTAPSTAEIFEIAKRAAGGYRYTNGLACSDINEERIKFPGTGSKYRCHTAAGVAIESGGTPSMVHLSERPKWERNKQVTYLSIINALPTIPTTMRIDESTAQGREEFWVSWEAGLEPDAPSRSIFIPWYVDDRLSAKVPDGFERTDDELDICRRAAAAGIIIPDRMLQWRRDKIHESGAVLFRQEFPSTPEEAVQTAEGLILPNPRTCIVDGKDGRPLTLPFDYRKVPAETLVGGIDFGYSATDATVIWSGVLWGAKLYLLEFWRAFGALAEEQAEALMPGHRYFYDPAGLGAAKELQKAAYLAQKRIKIAPAPRTRNVGEDCGTVEIHLLASWMARGKFWLTPQAAEQFIVEADSFCWNPKTGKPHDARGPLVGHYDTIMAAKYLVMGCERSPRRLESTVPEGHIPRSRGFSRV